VSDLDAPRVPAREPAKSRPRGVRLAHNCSGPGHRWRLPPAGRARQNGHKDEFCRDEIVASLNAIADTAERVSREGWWLLHIGL